MFHRIAITARSDFEDKEAILSDIVALLSKEGAEVCIDPIRCDLPSLSKCKKFEELRHIDLIIVVGGDGTILRTVRDLKDFSIPLLTVNRGTLGFLTECDIHELPHLIPHFLRGGGFIEERQMLYGRVMREGKEILAGLALNEIVVSQGAIARLIELKTDIGGSALTTFRSDGIIIATPTGSTAYSLAAGGPIMHPSIEGLIITPINAHAFSQKPLVVPSHETVEIEVLPRETKFEHIEVSLTFDGQTHHTLKRGDIVTVTRHDQHVRLLKRKQNSFYETLRGKLGWGE